MALVFSLFPVENYSDLSGNSDQSITLSDKRWGGGGSIASDKRWGGDGGSTSLSDKRWGGDGSIV